MSLRLLEGSKVTKYFGGLAALKDVDFSVRDKQIVGLIGPNGAGKTTLFNCISGVYGLTSGTIKFGGQPITHLKTYEICRLGIGRTHQIVRPFLNLSVLENVMIGGLFGRPGSKNMREARNEALHHLEFTGLLDKKYVPASSLTLCDRKMLEIARALAIHPKIVLLDEVLGGLNMTEINRAMELIKKIRDECGVTVFWIEHVMTAVMNLAEHIIVLDYGSKIAEGPPQLVTSDKKVIDAYLGVEAG